MTKEGGKYIMLYGIIFLVAGIYFLITPYEKLKAKFPNAKSPTALKVAGGISLVSGILIVALNILLNFQI